MIECFEEEDGSFTISWDHNDPLESQLNTWTEEDFIETIMEHCKEVLDQTRPVKWVLPVEMDGVNGEYFLTLRQDPLDTLEWVEGDQLEWSDNKDGSLSLKKVNDNGNV